MPHRRIIVVSTTLGQRRRYAVEMVVGIAPGIGIADALFVLIGSGTLQIAAIVAGAMVVAVALGGSVVLVSEAAVSALLVVTIQPPSSGLSGARFLDSLLGGLIALAITSLLPRDPARAARRAAALPFAQVVGTLEDVALALERADLKLAERALARARAVERHALEQAVPAGRETLQLAPFARAIRAKFGRYVRAEAQIDTAITSVESLSRAVVRALKFGDNVPPPMLEAIRHLSSAVRRLEEPAAATAGRLSQRPSTKNRGCLCRYCNLAWATLSRRQTHRPPAEAELADATTLAAAQWRAATRRSWSWRRRSLLGAALLLALRRRPGGDATQAPRVVFVSPGRLDTPRSLVASANPLRAGPPSASAHGDLTDSFVPSFREPFLGNSRPERPAGRP